MKEYDNYHIPYASYEGTGIIGFHAWTIVTKFKKSRECLKQTLDFIMPYFAGDGRQTKDGVTE